MSRTADDSPRPLPLDLDRLESDPTPTFVIKVGSTAINFEILYGNEAFRREGLRNVLLAEDRAAILFRSWTQAISRFQSNHDFANRKWKAKVAGANSDWKIIRAVQSIADMHEIKAPDSTQLGVRPLMWKQSEHKLLKELDQSTKVSLKEPPSVNINARWERLQTMMEMIDVGVFEYDPTGKLIQANDAWYRLSSHPRNLPAHVEFSFMDLAYPDDVPVIMSAWNTLLQGNPVTFEMRWKARPGSGETAQWVLSACVPVFDDEQNLISIAGNTIDINAQKKCQEVAQARVEALEQARRSERKFTRFAQLAPIAIYIFNPDKGMQYVNDQFFELTGNPHVPFDRLIWTDVLYEEDIDKMQSGWSDMMEGKKTGQMQFRLKKTWVNQEGVVSQIWVQGSSCPELDDNGNVISIMGTLFDISQFKWAEGMQRRRVDEALEAKRHQENFIDMTAHELRNPLSAIVQCADSVMTTLQQLTSKQLEQVQPDVEKTNEEIAMCIESLQTIVSCSLHQKRVIDDVLTLSKLDSSLLLITPMRVRPSVVVTDALKMFEVECNRMHIGLEFKEDESLKDFEWVMMDPSRVVQVLINLLTNAIKFTEDRKTRKITVTLGGAWTRPSTEWQTVTFAENITDHCDICDKPGWGNGPKGYIWLKVDDSGCGMTLDETKKLFSRFTQATPRTGTYIKYGGSGLGLFTSKSLVALQGGAIGVTSQADIGSTFVFYISTRTAHGPKDASSGEVIRPVLHRSISAENAMKEARLNILIVEDNLVNQKVLSKQLQRVGCNVYVAGNGVEALEWLQTSVYWKGEKSRRESPDDSLTPVTDISSTPDETPGNLLDIILMDIEMPIMDGLTCARLIRDYEQQGLLGSPIPRPFLARQLSTSSVSPISTFHEISISEQRASWQTEKRIPILTISANARNEQVEQALAAGMDDAISKPFRILELWPKMARLVPRCAGLGMSRG
ncbi:hypothetical protein K458DRAFT_487227 [Lentithecium fluviatile CBS 122367]|uniref:Histidine kinase HHK8p n=1 Tax=Lentithecium fluviatile CBS 122367 TaxID=1168545 RepID=A0A6G1J172_9PLEO|nr:hypothetical protein K458DRAFT_487227 [Lentithecium fluviatile CBS 122367]